MRIIRSEELSRMPWKNGGGETTEIAVFPAGASLDDFEWRVSMATVAADGPFSAFPGIDRTLSILEGEGIRLEVEGKPSMTLTQASDPFSFPADVPTSSALLGGPIVDLNVMSRRGRWRHHVEKWRFEGQHHFDAPGGATMILALGNLRVESGGHAAELHRHDSVFVEEVVLLTSDIPVDGYLVRLTKS